MPSSITIAEPRQCVSVLVPVFNEEDTLGEVMDRLIAMPVVSQIVVVDDGSQDSGLDGLAVLNDPRVMLVRHEKNLGKGAAIRTALAHATKNVVVIQDADLEYAPEEIPRLLVAIEQGEAEVVYGTRFGSHSAGNTPLVRYLANRFLTFMSNRVMGLSLTDMETGHKAFRREALEGIVIQENRFGFEPEITAKLARRGVRLAEMPVSYRPRSYAEGKKIGVRDGIQALWCIIRYSWWS